MASLKLKVVRYLIRFSLALVGFIVIFRGQLYFRGIGFSFITVRFTLGSYSHNVFQIMHLGANIKLRRNQLTRRLSRTANLWLFWFKLASVFTVVILGLVVFAAT